MFAQGMMVRVKNHSEYLLLSLLCLFHLAVNSIWILNDFSFRYTPHFIYTYTITTLNKLEQGKFLLYPLYSLISVLFLKIFGCRYFVFNIVASLFLIILIISVYGICRTMGYRKAGILAAFLVSFYPIVFSTSRWHDYWVPLIAMGALTSWLLLLANRNASILGWLLWATMFVAGGVMGKSTYTEMLIFYIGIMGGLVWVISANLYTIFSDTKRWDGAVKNLFCVIGFGLGGLLFVYHLIGPLFDIPYYLSEAYKDKYIAEQNQVLALTTYFINITSRQAGHFAALLFLIAIVPFMKSVKRYKWFLILWMFFPLVIFSLIGKKNIYYTNSILPAFAIITAIGITKVRHKLIRTIVTFLLLLVFIQYYFLSFGPAFAAQKFVFSPPFYESPYLGNPAFYCYPPSDKHREELINVTRMIVSRINVYLRGNDRDPRIVVIRNGYNPLPSHVAIMVFCELYQRMHRTSSTLKEFEYLDKSLLPQDDPDFSLPDSKEFDEYGFGRYVSNFRSGEIVIVESKAHELFDKSEIESNIGRYYDFVGEYVYVDTSLYLFFRKKNNKKLAREGR